MSTGSLVGESGGFDREILVTSAEPRPNDATALEIDHGYDFQNRLPWIPIREAR